MSALAGAVVLVTGANGGIGTEFVHQALARGAKKVYATARTPRDWDDDRIVPLTLDVTDATSIGAAVDTAMAAHADGSKMKPADLVELVYDAVEAGEYEVIADEVTAQVKAGLSAPVEVLYPELLNPTA